MNLRSIIAHAILALGGLTLAYMVWTDDAPDVGENAVTIFECAPDELTQVDLRVDDREVQLRLEGEGDERVAWFTVTRRPENGEPTTERFVGSKEAIDYLEQIAPLRAERSLGTLDDQQLEDVGLKENTGRLELRCGSRRQVFRVGSRSYGSGDRYVRNESGGQAYLVDGERIQPLESAEFRLMQRELHTFEWRDVTALTVRGLDREKRLLQHNRLDEQRAEWVDAADPGRRNELYGNWLTHFPRLRVQKYLDPNARPGADLEGVSANGQPVLRIDIVGDDGPLGFVEMQRVDGGPEPAYYVKTETTRSWVRVAGSVAQEIETDLRPVLGLAPLEPPPTPDAGAPRPAADAGVPGAATPTPPANPHTDPHGDPHADPHRGMLPPGHP